MKQGQRDRDIAETL